MIPRHDQVRDETNAFVTELQARRHPQHPGLTEQEYQHRQAREAWTATTTALFVLLAVVIAVGLWVMP